MALLTAFHIIFCIVIIYLTYLRITLRPLKISQFERYIDEETKYFTIETSFNVNKDILYKYVFNKLQIDYDLCIVHNKYNGSKYLGIEVYYSDNMDAMEKYRFKRLFDKIEVLIDKVDSGSKKIIYSAIDEKELDSGMMKIFKDIRNEIDMVIQLHEEGKIKIDYIFKELLENK